MPLPPWIHWPKKTHGELGWDRALHKKKNICKKQMTHYSHTCWRYHHIWILSKNIILLYKGIILIANVLAKEKIFYHESLHQTFISEYIHMRPEVKSYLIDRSEIFKPLWDYMWTHFYLKGIFFPKWNETLKKFNWPI